MTVKKLYLADDGFSFIEDSKEHFRAGIELDKEIPDSYKRIVIECFEKGWIKPVAYIREQELIWDKLHE